MIWIIQSDFCNNELQMYTQKRCTSFQHSQFEDRKLVPSLWLSAIDIRFLLKWERPSFQRQLFKSLLSKCTSKNYTIEIYAALHIASVLLCSRQAVWAGPWVGNPKVLLLSLKSNMRNFCLTLVCVQQTFKFRYSSTRQVRGITLHSRFRSVALLFWQLSADSVPFSTG